MNALPVTTQVSGPGGGELVTAPLCGAQVDGLSEEDFERRVMQSKAPVLVAICGRSDEANRRLSKLLGEFEPLLKGRLEVLYVNAEAVLALADRLGVQWVPGLVVFSRGALCYQFMGDAVRSDLEELLARVSALTENTGVGATPGGSQGMSNGEAWLSHRNDS